MVVWSILTDIRPITFEGEKMTRLDYDNWLTDGNEIIDPAEATRCEMIAQDTSIIRSDDRRYSVLTDNAAYSTDDVADALAHAEAWFETPLSQNDDSVRIYDRFSLLQWLSR